MSTAKKPGEELNATVVKEYYERKVEKAKEEKCYLVVKRRDAPFEELELIGPYTMEQCLNIGARVPPGYDIVITTPKQL